MARLSLSLLGTFEVTLADRPVAAFEYDKVRALLAYLAVEVDRPHRREALAGLLWPERPERRAHQSLSQALFKLRRAIGDLEAEPSFLLVTPQTLQFNPSSDYRLDVTTFTNLLTACHLHSHDRLESCQACMDRLQQAVALYRGNFLAGFSLGDSPAFEEWLVLTQERLQRLACEALAYLAGYFETRAEYDQALLYARREVELEPWREETHRHLMRLLILNGQRGAALAQYETCRQALAEELSLEPEAETTALYRQICDSRLSRGAGAPLDYARNRPGRRGLLPPAARPFSAHVPFVARERELAQLNEFLNRALAGQGQVVFVTGGPGRGKTALIWEFARCCQAAQPDLIVAGGIGNAHGGAGDPYLPFRDILGQLTGDVEAVGAAGAAGRLWPLLPLALQLLIEAGPDLIGTFLPGEWLARRVAALISWPGRLEWLAQLEQHLERQADPADPAPRQQSDLFEQYTRLLRLLAEQNPLLLLLDDLQWADQSSINLLFHLGRRLEGSRLLIVGAYRPVEVAIGYPAERHPLEPVVNEFRRLFGAIEIDLSQAEDRRFVDALLDSEPNSLAESFRQILYRQTGGHPLFTVELLRGMQERGDLVRDQAGRWIEGAALDWETLPARVEAVIAERIERLPERLREILTVASVEGETFTAEVIAQVQAAEPLELVRQLSEALERTHRLVTAQGTWQRNGQHLSRYRFRHYLFQKYLYSRLDPAERVYLHEAVGLALERLYGEAAGELAVQLARHFQEAGLAGRAIGYLGAAKLLLAGLAPSSPSQTTLSGCPPPPTV